MAMVKMLLCVLFVRNIARNNVTCGRLGSSGPLLQLLMVSFLPLLLLLLLLAKVVATA
jgi:hypothetical protein